MAHNIYDSVDLCLFYKPYGIHRFAILDTAFITGIISWARFLYGNFLSDSDIKVSMKKGAMSHQIICDSKVYKHEKQIHKSFHSAIVQTSDSE